MSSGIENSDGEVNEECHPYAVYLMETNIYIEEASLEVHCGVHRQQKFFLLVFFDCFTHGPLQHYCM